MDIRTMLINVQLSTKLLTSIVSRLSIKVRPRLNLKVQFIQQRNILDHN